MYKSQHLSQFFQKKKLWYNPSNRMYFDSRHCINISPDIFTDIQKKKHTLKPPQKYWFTQTEYWRPYRKCIKFNRSNQQKQVYTGTSNRSPFCETGPPNQDVSWCQQSTNQPDNSSSNRKCLAYGTGSVIYWPGENTQASGSQGNFRLKSNFQSVIKWFFILKWQLKFVIDNAMSRLF